jgi:cell shape-determining protein MreD
LARTARESLPIIFVAGLIMDELSCSPLMLHVIAYLWIYVSLKWVTKVLQVGNRLRLPFIVSIGVLIENFIFISNIALVEPGLQFPGAAVRIAAVQVMWAIFTGPLFLVFFEKAQRTWDRWLSGIFIRRSNLEHRKTLQ